MRSFENLDYSMSVLVCGSQMGKSEAVLDVVGHRIDERPVPVLYVGPSQDFIVDELEPRLMDLINQSETLSDKISRGKKNKRFRKVVGGVPIRLAWAGSATQLSSTSSGLMIIDEYDRMLGNVKGEGDPLGLVKARGFTYRDRKYGVTSTPLEGVVETEVDSESGLEFFKKMPPEDIKSAVWKLWQAGTMYHFAWPCPQCEDWFIPKMKNLHPKPDEATVMEAKRNAYIECPSCGGVIQEEHKEQMNARGVFVAPGQKIRRDGTVVGTPPESQTISFWVSGLCSPFVTFGERAAELIEATDSGSSDRLQTVVNTGFGELWSPGGGDAPEWVEVARLKQPYQSGDVPDDVRVLTAGVDVQKNRLVYSVRGWGPRATSWLIQAGELFGETSEPDVWADLAELLTSPFDGMMIKCAMVDSGFRPGKPFLVPDNRVYDFCRNFRRLAWATKGRASQSKPISVSKIEVTPSGSARKYGLELLLLNSDEFKSFVHQRVRWPSHKPGAWLLPQDTTEDYCRQIVSESRTTGPTGQPHWIKRSKDNHFLDCEALNAAAAHMLQAYRIRGDLTCLASPPEDVVSVKPELSEPERKQVQQSKERKSAPRERRKKRSWADMANQLNR